MRKLVATSITMLAFLAVACEEDAICFHNCPQDPATICEQTDMEPGEQDECEQRATEMCAQYPERLEAFDGEVMFKLVTCSGNENCGVPNFCLNNYQP